MQVNQQVFWRHQRSANNVAQKSNVAEMGFRRQSLRTIPNVLRHAGSMTSIVSDTPSGYNDGHRYQRQQRTRHRPKPVTGTQAQQPGAFRAAGEPSRVIFVYRVVEDTHSDASRLISKYQNG